MPAEGEGENNVGAGGRCSYCAGIRFAIAAAAINVGCVYPIKARLNQRNGSIDLRQRDSAKLYKVELVYNRQWARIPS